MLTSSHATGAATATGRFDVPSACGSPREFEAALRARLGNEATPVMREIELSIVPRGTVFRLILRLGADTRQFEDTSCTDLFRASVVVAISLWEAPSAQRPNRLSAETPEQDPIAPPPNTSGRGSQSLAEAIDTPSPPSAAAGSMPSPNAAARTSPAAVASEPPSPASTTAARPASAGGFGSEPAQHSEAPFLGWSLAGQLGVSAGLQPKMGPSLGVRAAYDRQQFGFSLKLTVLPDNSQQDATHHGLSAFGIGAEPAAFFKPFANVFVEFGASLFLLSGNGLGSKNNRRATRVSLGPRLGVGIIFWRFKGLFAQAGVEGQLPLLRPIYEIRDYGEVFQVGRLAGAAHLGAGVRFH